MFDLAFVLVQFKFPFFGTFQDFFQPVVMLFLSGTPYQDMQDPKSKEELQRFLGMTTYLAKFIPNYSQLSAPLRQLLEKNTEWHWSPRQTQALEALKAAITKHPALSYFNPQKPTKISVDASSHGMGAVLLTR